MNTNKKIRSLEIASQLIEDISEAKRAIIRIVENEKYGQYLNDVDCQANPQWAIDAYEKLAQVESGLSLDIKRAQLTKEEIVRKIGVGGDGEDWESSWLMIEMVWGKMTLLEVGKEMVEMFPGVESIILADQIYQRCREG